MCYAAWFAPGYTWRPPRASLSLVRAPLCLTLRAREGGRALRNSWLLCLAFTAKLVLDQERRWSLIVNPKRQERSWDLPPSRGFSRDTGGQRRRRHTLESARVTHINRVASRWKTPERGACRAPRRKPCCITRTLSLKSGRPSAQREDGRHSQNTNAPMLTLHAPNPPNAKVRTSRSYIRCRRSHRARANVLLAATSC